MAQWSDMRLNTLAFWESFEAFMMKLRFSRPKAKMLRNLAFRAVWRIRGLVQWLLAPDLIFQLVMRHMFALAGMYMLYGLLMVLSSCAKCVCF
jgi:hypothetical protein